MNLRQACEIAYNAGLDTVGEAVFTAELYADTLFSYGSEAKEYQELLADVHKLLCRIMITDVFPDLEAETENVYEKDVSQFDTKKGGKVDG